MSEQLRVTTFNGSGAICLRAAGEIDLSTVREFEEALEQHADAGAAIHVDLSEISFIDSTGLHALARARERARRDGWTFEIVKASHNVERLLELTGLSDWLATASRA